MFFFPCQNKSFKLLEKGKMTEIAVQAGVTESPLTPRKMMLNFLMHNQVKNVAKVQICVCIKPAGNKAEKEKEPRWTMEGKRARDERQVRIKFGCLLFHLLFFS